MKIENLLYQVLNAIPLSIWVLFALAMILRIGASIWGPKLKGWIGERVTSRIGLGRLPKTGYSVYNDLYLPRPDALGTTQIDHVVVSRYGLFVVETKNYKGWIFGSEGGKRWTVSLGRQKFQFQNPLHQNELHIRALSEYLKVERNLFVSIVFFVGQSAFKTDLPPNVLETGLRDYIRSFQKEQIGNDDVERINRSLANLDRSLDRRSLAKTHSKAIQNRMSQQPVG